MDNNELSLIDMQIIDFLSNMATDREAFDKRVKEYLESRKGK